MTNRPRSIGTAAESAVVRAARSRGFPWAERIVLHGALDHGDIRLCPGVIIEVKGGEAARGASDSQIDRWLDETDRERANARADVGLLVIQRRGIGAPNAHRWTACWRWAWLLALYSRHIHDDTIGLTVVRMTLDDALTHLRAAGYGDPLTQEAA